MLLGTPREIAVCYIGAMPTLFLRLHESALGAWEVELRGRDAPRIAHRFDSEADARRALEVAYEYGRQQGGWWQQQRLPI